MPTNRLGYEQERAGNVLFSFTSKRNVYKTVILKILSLVQTSILTNPRYRTGQGLFCVLKKWVQQQPAAHAHCTKHQTTALDGQLVGKDCVWQNEADVSLQRQVWTASWWLKVPELRWNGSFSKGVLYSEMSHTALITSQGIKVNPFDTIANLSTKTFWHNCLSTKTCDKELSSGSVGVSRFQVSHIKNSKSSISTYIMWQSKCIYKDINLHVFTNYQSRFQLHFQIEIFLSNLTSVSFLFPHCGLILFSHSSCI